MALRSHSIILHNDFKYKTKNFAIIPSKYDKTQTIPTFKPEDTRLICIEPSLIYVPVFYPRPQLPAKNITVAAKPSTSKQQEIVPNITQTKISPKTFSHS
eukprot:490273_1